MEKEILNTTTTTIEFSVQIKQFDMNKGELIDAIASGSKLTKADAGRLRDSSIENNFSFKLEPTVNADGTFGTPKLDAMYFSKEIPCSCYEL